MLLTPIEMFEDDVENGLSRRPTGLDKEQSYKAKEITEKIRMGHFDERDLLVHSVLVGDRRFAQTLC